MEFLVRLEDKKDIPGKGVTSKKGDFITFKPDGWTWGNNEWKHYGIVRIVCTEDEASKMCESLYMTFGNEEIMTQYRKKKLDIESTIPTNILVSWNDKSLYSTIVTVENIECL